MWISIGTLVVAFCTLIFSAYTAGKASGRWNADRTVQRFGDALTRALSPDSRVAAVGRSQVEGMLERNELDDRDLEWAQDGLDALRAHEPTGFTSGRSPVILEDNSAGESEEPQ